MNDDTSQAVTEILEGLVRDFGDVEINAESAANIFAGDSSIKVSELSKSQLMQLAICQYRDLVQSMEQIIEGQRHIIQTRAKPKIR